MTQAGKIVLTTLGCAILAGAAGTAQAAAWYVGPQGTAAGRGTQESPWDIESALLGRHPVQPGDTIYLLAGTYRRRPHEQFEVTLAGAEGKPIHVRPAPGQRAIIDGGLLVRDPAAHVWIWDLEILVSEPNTTVPIGPGSHPEDFKRPWGGLNMNGGTECKYIDLVIHDTRQGVSFWTAARDSELYGCLIYDNGWPATDRGHGHAIYTQNKDGIKTISDCIMAGGYGFTLHAYGSARADVDNYLVEGNICYKNGSRAFLIGGGKPSHHIRVFDNYLYDVNMQLGYSAPYNEDCEVRDNVIVNGALTIRNYKKVTEEGNLILSPGDARPPGARVSLRPNKYEPDRANLTIYNWDRKPSVAVDARALLKRGDAYRLMNPRDFFGKPVVEGTFDGKSISVPVEGEFAAFVLLRGRGGTRDSGHRARQGED